VAVAVLVTACWILAAKPAAYEFLTEKSEAYKFLKQSGLYQFVMSYFHDSLPGTKKILGFVLFYEILFLVSFVFAHIILWYKKLNSPEFLKQRRIGKDLRHLGWELLASIVSGAIGGAVLYLFAKMLPVLTSKIINWLDLYNIQVKDDIIYICFGPPLFLVTVLLSTTFFFAFAGKIYSDMDREWLSRFGALLLLVILVWSILFCIVLISPQMINKNIFGKLLGINKEILPASVIIAIVSGLITLVLGFSGRSPANADKESKSVINIIWKFAPQVAAPIFALALIILISYGTSQLMESALPGLVLRTSGIPVIGALVNSDLGYLVFWILLFVVIGGTMGILININKFSLHAMYRERIIRAYLGASRTKERLKTANSFTDLDDKDNVEAYKLGTQKPFHVVNITLNLGKANNLRWQDRKAASFTVSPLHCGSSNMGDSSGYYRSSEKYGYSHSNNQSITLGTAAAISGAAVSPNMGYYSMSSAVSFLMALFNVRLGWWLGNPGKRGGKTYMRSAPKWSPMLLIDEAFGDTTDTNPYVYLSDGGHFDNLGLYEMVLRRCHFIVACDAGADSKFGFFDLGTAIHKIRVDMGIPINFKAGMPVEGRNCAIAEIEYSAVDGEKAKDGFLIYIKPTLDGDEPIDVVNYKNINRDFPHETTGDEFYSETQFESYRSLGFHMINSIVKNKPACTNISDFKKYAESYLAKMSAAAKKSKTEPEATETPVTDLVKRLIK